MKRITGIMSVISCLVILSLLERAFNLAESTIQPQLFSSGRMGQWWAIVLLYWVLDTAVVLLCGRILDLTMGRRQPANYPFWQFGVDATIAVLLLHLALLMTDTYLRPAFRSVGLDYLTTFLLVAGTLQVFVIGVKCGWLSGFQKPKELPSLTPGPSSY